MGRITFIINPASGAQKAMKVWQHIEKSGLLNNVNHEVQFTGWPGHASLLTRQAIEEGSEKIIVVGGDGTLNECVNGFMLSDPIKREKCSIGLIPHGTGSDWARHHKLPTDTIEALNFALENSSSKHDVGEILFERQGNIRSRYFINISTLNFGAVAANSANEFKITGKSGKLVYIRAVLKHLFSYKSLEVELKIGDKIVTQKMFLIAVGICSSNGAGLKLCPNAVSDNAKFYITNVGDIKIHEVLLNIFGLFNGSFIKHPKVEVIESDSLSIRSSNEEIDMEVDGEYLGKGNCEYRMHAGILNAII